MAAATAWLVSMIIYNLRKPCRKNTLVAGLPLRNSDHSTVIVSAKAVAVWWEGTRLETGLTGVACCSAPGTPCAEGVMPTSNDRAS